MTPTTRLGTSTTPTKDPLKRGFFTKGQWHCNCQPRLPAVQFQVRRDSKNKGRWFYTCQKARSKGAPGAPDKCDFFLWAEDARLREEGALLRRPCPEATPTQKRMRQTTLSASVTPRAAAEKRAGPTPVVPLSQLGGQMAGRGAAASSSRSSQAASSATLRASDAGRTQASSARRDIDVETDSDDESSDDTSEDELAPAPTKAAPRRGLGGPPQAGDKRKRDDAEAEEEEDYGDWSSDEEQQLAAITDSSSRGPGAQGRKRDAFATPAATARTHDAVAGLPTPSFTDRPLRRVLFTEPEVSTPAKRPRTTTEPADSASSPPSSPPTAAQPPSAAAAAAAATATPGGSGGPGVTAVVMGLLRNQKVDGAVRARVREELERCEARARGLERGRDAARQATKQLEARAAQLQQRVVALENERQLHADARDNLRTGLMKLYSES